MNNNKTGTNYINQQIGITKKYEVKIYGGSLSWLTRCKKKDMSNI